MSIPMVLMILHVQSTWLFTPNQTQFFLLLLTHPTATWLYLLNLHSWDQVMIVSILSTILNLFDRGFFAVSASILLLYFIYYLLWILIGSALPSNKLVLIYYSTLFYFCLNCYKLFASHSRYIIGWCQIFIKWNVYWFCLSYLWLLLGNLLAQDSSPKACLRSVIFLDQKDSKLESIYFPFA